MQPRVAISDLHYLGAFKLPSVWSADDPNATFSYNDDGLAFNPLNHTLFVKSHVYGQMVAEMSIPAAVDSSDASALNTASFVQDFADIAEDNLDQENIANGMRLGGLLVYGNQLIGAEWAYYDGASAQTKSHFTSGLSLAASGDYHGMYTVGDLFPAFVGGHMASIPAEWQSAFAGHALTGHCCTSIIGHQSLGPSASVFNPEDLGVLNPVPAHPLVNYPIDHPTLGV